MRTTIAMLVTFCSLAVILSISAAPPANQTGGLSAKLEIKEWRIGQPPRGGVSLVFTLANTTARIAHPHLTATKLELVPLVEAQ
jgi:hypothetical protein